MPQNKKQDESNLHFFSLSALSVAEVAPSNSAMLTRSGVLLLQAAENNVDGAVTWAIEMLERALEERDDNPNIYRFLAIAHWLNDDHVSAINTLTKATVVQFDRRYGPVRETFARESEIIVRDSNLKAGESVEKEDYQFRVTLSWETDANDIDLHVQQGLFLVLNFNFNLILF